MTPVDQVDQVDLVEGRRASRLGVPVRHGHPVVVVACALALAVAGTAVATAAPQAPAGDVEVVLTPAGPSQPTAAWTVRAVLDGSRCTGPLDWRRTGVTAGGDDVVLVCEDGSTAVLRVTADSRPDTGLRRLSLVLDPARS